MTNAQMISHNVGLVALWRLFEGERAEFIRESRKYIHYYSAPTKKRHIHRKRPAGSKLLKRWHRSQWDLMVSKEKRV